MDKRYLGRNRLWVFWSPLLIPHLPPTNIPYETCTRSTTTQEANKSTSQSPRPNTRAMPMLQAPLRGSTSSPHVPEQPRRHHRDDHPTQNHSTFPRCSPPKIPHRWRHSTLDYSTSPSVRTRNGFVPPTSRKPFITHSSLKNASDGVTFWKVSSAQNGAVWPALTWLTQGNLTLWKELTEYENASPQYMLLRDNFG